MYLLDTQNLGQLHAGDSGAVQASAISAGEIRGGPVVWSRAGTAGGPLFYNWGAGDALKAFAFAGRAYATTPAATFSGAPLLYPGGELALSANGSSNGIVWAIVNSSGDADHRVPPGELHAFDAANVSRELWKSTANPARDDFGLMAKWVPPLVANGRVYVATSSNQVVAYGLLPSGGAPLVSVWPPRQPALGGSADFVVKAMTPAGTAASATWSVAGLPPAAGATFSTDAHGRVVLRVALGATTPRGSYRLQVSAGTGSSQAALLDVPDTTSVKATATATDSQDVANPLANATDGNSATFWHSQFQGGSPGYPHQITVDLGSVQAVSGLSYLPRQDGCVNGTLFKYEIHLSVDGVNWLEETTGGSFDYGPDLRSFACAGASFPLRQSIGFPPTNARYVNLVGLSAAVDGQPWASAAEIAVYAAQGKVPLTGRYVLAARHSGQVATVSGNSAAYGAQVVQSPYVRGANQQWAIAPSSTAGYDTLTAASTGLLFDISGASHANGALLIQWPANGGTNQQFGVLPAGDGRGFSTVGILSTPGLCLDVLNVSQVVGAAIAQWGCNGGRNQQWYLSPANPAVP
jgi:F5/8 type C domain/Ricin-type beta-trefoil lectin domain-like